MTVLSTLIGFVGRILTRWNCLWFVRFYIETPTHTFWRRFLLELFQVETSNIEFSRQQQTNFRWNWKLRFLSAKISLKKKLTLKRTGGIYSCNLSGWTNLLKFINCSGIDSTPCKWEYIIEIDQLNWHFIRFGTYSRTKIFVVTSSYRNVYYNLQWMETGGEKKLREKRIQM